jgi:hypothetical protein
MLLKSTAAICLYDLMRKCSQWAPSIILLVTGFPMCSWLSGCCKCMALVKATTCSLIDEVAAFSDRVAVFDN